MFIRKLTPVDLAPISYAITSAQKLDLSGDKEEANFYNFLRDNFNKFMRIIEANTGVRCSDRLNNKQIDTKHGIKLRVIFIINSRLNLMK